ncbi:MAG: circadian clock protein KaiA [Coleofasciculaceae cyanobacterium SM2_1_6]|nr:circadian clock protein KaiA [Coleofasciculaceae cyanobacterium SM2_1_6]
MLTQLSLCSFVSSPELSQKLKAVLGENEYHLYSFDSAIEFGRCVVEKQQEIDCLLCQVDRTLLPVINRLHEQGILLPMVIFPNSTTSDYSVYSPKTELLHQATYLFHPAEVCADDYLASEILPEITKAIAQFVDFASHLHPSEISAKHIFSGDSKIKNFLMPHELSEKLKARLGYLGVYYKRNSQQFWRNLSDQERQKLLSQLQQEYRHIVLQYFTEDEKLNQDIDNLVNRAFFADISVPQIVEIHMDLMDEFSNQLKLEGRSEEVLLDYRLTLIDVIAHLCEMYRRSIPREM